jgi:L-aspartate oxidase
MKEYYDAIIVGTGAAGLYCALNLPERKNVLLITKQEADQSDSFLAQGGICMLRGEEDYNDYFEDTMRAGHYENNKKAVELMLRLLQLLLPVPVFQLLFQSFAQKVHMPSPSLLPL